MTEDIFRNLVEKYLNGTIDQKGENQLFEAIEQAEYASLLSEIMDRQLSQGGPDRNDYPETYQRIHDYVQAHKEGARLVPMVKRRWLRPAAVAAVFLSAIATTYFLLRPVEQKVLTQSERFKNDVLPAKATTVLKLDNGQLVNLQEVPAGVIAVQGKVRVIKTQSGEIRYEGLEENTVLYNEIVSVKGQKQTVVLPDGSVVTLNAESSIRYPLTFVKERVVSMNGEAHFVVKHNDAMPFKTMVARTVIEDLGTEFNIRSYANDGKIRTTLLDGSVRVNTKTNKTVLVPGQQAIILNGHEDIRTTQPDLEEVMAWKNGLFNFKEASIEEIMHQLERWYDIKVAYNGKIAELFIVEVPRNTPLSTVLKILENTGSVKFTIDGNTVTVLP